MNKLIILVIIIGIIVVGISYYTTSSNITINKDPLTDSFKIGIIQWVTSEDFDANISEFKYFYSRVG